MKLIIICCAFVINLTFFACIGVKRGHGQVSLPVAAGLGWMDEIELKEESKSKTTIATSALTSLHAFC